MRVKELCLSTINGESERKVLVPERTIELASLVALAAHKIGSHWGYSL